MKSGLKQTLFYSVSCLLIMLVISKCMITVLAILKTEPESHHQEKANRSDAIWSEKDIRKFEELADQKKKFFYQGVDLKTLDAYTKAVTRHDPDIKVTLNSTRVMEVEHQKTYLSMLVLTIKNESDQTLTIDRTSWKYVDHNHKTIPMDHQLNLLGGTYMSKEVKIGIVLVPSKSRRVQTGTLIIPYTHKGKVKEVIMRLDGEKT